MTDPAGTCAAIAASEQQAPPVQGNTSGRVIAATKVGQGNSCNSTGEAEGTGCTEGLRCGTMTTAGVATPEVCMNQDNCGKDENGTAVTCGAKTLVATLAATFAIASTL